MRPTSADIVGVGAYLAGKASHISGVVAARRHADDPACRARPRPLGAPRRSRRSARSHRTPRSIPRESGRDPVGRALLHRPYLPAKGRAGGNPNYHGSRPHHFARIELSVRIPLPGRSPQSGRYRRQCLAGLRLEPFRGGTRRGLPTRRPVRARQRRCERGKQRYFRNLQANLAYFVFNTHRPLFAGARMRQAVSYAIDRRALAAVNSPFSLHPTDHYLPPGMPGYRDVHIYP